MATVGRKGCERVSLIPTVKYCPGEQTSVVECTVVNKQAIINI